MIVSFLRLPNKRYRKPRVLITSEAYQPLNDAATALNWPTGMLVDKFSTAQSDILVVMLYTIKCPLYGRLHIDPDSAGHMKAERDGILVELTTTRLKDRRPGMASPVDEISMTVRVPPDELAQFVKQVGLELVDGSVYANLHKKLIAELQTFESGFSFAFGEEFPIEKLAWDRWVEEFTPETDAEAEALRITRVGAIAPRTHHGNMVALRHLRRYFAQANRYVDLRACQEITR